MPMDRSRYPENWDAIALKVKEAADWTCQKCGRPCLRPGEDLLEFVDRVAPVGANHTCDNRWGIEDEDGHLKLGRFVLTVAHLDQNPANCEDGNLKALCPPCHLRHDAPHRAANSYRKRERRGQLNLLQEFTP